MDISLYGELYKILESLINLKWDKNYISVLIELPS